MPGESGGDPHAVIERPPPQAATPTPPGDSFSCTVCDARWLPFPDATFDRVVANHMLYHVSDRPAALREAARVLRGAGVFIATTNGRNHLAELNALARRHGFEMGSLSSDPFTLENGEAQLREVFDHVVCERYEDSLRVTETEPLVQYVLSTTPSTAVDVAAIESLRAEAAQAIRRDGFIHITKEAGLFRATTKAS